MAIYGDVVDGALQKLISAVAASIRQPNGSILTEFKDRSGRDVPVSIPAAVQATVGKATEFELVIRVNPDGSSAKAWVKTYGPKGNQAIEGMIDTTVLATKLV